MATDFTDVTEVAGARATREQLSMIQTRYAEAARIGAGRRVLEVACGAGRGLGLIASRARWTVGGDFTLALVDRARRQYGDRVPILRLDAQALPFRDRSFDVVVLFEAIYYLPNADRFVAESRRVLTAGGQLFVCSANPEWSGFVSSAHVTTCFSARELVALLSRHGFDTSVRGAFPVAARGLTGRVVSLARRLALRAGLVPPTLAARERLKRLFYGPLTSLGPEVHEGDADVGQLVPIDVGHQASQFKVIYALGRRTERAV